MGGGGFAPSHGSSPRSFGNSGMHHNGGMGGSRQFNSSPGMGSQGRHSIGGTNGNMNRGGNLNHGGNNHLGSSSMGQSGARMNHGNTGLQGQNGHHGGTQLGQRHTGNPNNGQGNAMHHQVAHVGNHQGGVNNLNHNHNGNWNGNHHGNNGWNGNWGNRHRGWHRGFWGGGFYPWWGFGGWGYGFGYPYFGLGLGLGYGLGYGLGGWGYPYYGYGGYGYGMNNWGYGGYSNYYYNPYCTSPLVLGSTVVDYSQPLAAATGPETAVADQAPVPNDNDPETVAAMADFDTARHAFMNGDYDAALSSVNRSIEKLPSDAVLHEFRGLVLFAQGKYMDAAAAIHAVLAGGPGWDWATLRGLYPDVATYERQLRALEANATANPTSADARFLLGYHYMTEGYTDAGLRQFKKVTDLQPNDMLAQQIVKAATTGQSGPSGSQAAPANANDIPLIVPAAPVTSQTPPAKLTDVLPRDTGALGQTVAKPTVDQLTGSWSATHEKGGKFAFNLTPEGTFKWTFTEGDKTNTLEGKYTLANDLIVLEPKEGPPMIGRVSDAGAEGFQFKMLGAPDDDPGLKFTK